MSYIGNNPDVNAFTVSVERFSGDSSCTQFQLTRTNYSDNNAIEVVISGLQQNPTANYGVENGLITFTSAPPVGSNNIVVTYRAPVVVTFNQVTESQIQPNAVGTTQLATGSVTNPKIADATILGSKIAENQISGNLIQSGAVSGNNIVDNAVRGNNIVAGTITGNLIADTAVAGNNIVPGTITGNLIADGAISANNLANPDNFEDMFFLGGM